MYVRVHVCVCLWVCMCVYVCHLCWVLGASCFPGIWVIFIAACCSRWSGCDKEKEENAGENQVMQVSEVGEGGGIEESNGVLNLKEISVVIKKGNI